MHPDPSAGEPRPGGRGRIGRRRGRLPRQPVPEGQPQLHPARDPRARAAGRRRSSASRCAAGTRTSPIAPMRRNRRARATCSQGGALPLAGAVLRDVAARAGSLRARARDSRCACRAASTAPLAVPPRLPRRGLPGCAGGCAPPASPICTPTSAPTRPRSRCWRASSAGRRTASPCTAPRSSTSPEALHLAEQDRRAAFVVAISSFGRSQLYRWIDARPVAEGARSCTAASTRDSDASRPSDPPDAPRLVCVGRLCEQKGQLLLVEAAAAASSTAAGRSKLVLAGDGEMRGAIEALDRRARPRRERAHHRLDRQRAGARRDARGARAGAAELRRRTAGRDHGGDGAAPAGDLAPSSPAFPSWCAPARRAGWFRPATSTRWRERCEAACGDAGAEPRAHGRSGAHRACWRATIEVEAAKLAELFARGCGSRAGLRPGRDDRLDHRRDAVARRAGAAARAGRSCCSLQVCRRRGRIGRRRGSSEPARARRRRAVLMPAHDEAAGIAAAIAARPAAAARRRPPAGRRRQLQRRDRRRSPRAAGAEVIERHDADRRGKGYALDFGVRHLAAAPPAVVIVVDADCAVAPGSVDRLAPRVRATRPAGAGALPDASRRPAPA